MFTLKETIRTNGVRQRTLNNWKLNKYPNGDITLLGIVGKDSETDKPADAIRFTETSPIQYRVYENDQHKLVTKSGSVYTLGNHLDNLNSEEIKLLLHVHFIERK